MPSSKETKRGYSVAYAIHELQADALAENEGEQSTGASATGVAIAAIEEGIGAGVGRYRWVICGLLFFATTINYVDRLVFSILGPELQKTFHWTNKIIRTSFFGLRWPTRSVLLVAGRVLDRIGTRIGYTISLIFWSLAAILHALMSTILGFSIARFLLGLGESGNFPRLSKQSPNGFPKKNARWPRGIFNAGSNVGAIIAPLGIPWLYLNYGWQWAFIFTGGLGLLWIRTLADFLPGAERAP